MATTLTFDIFAKDKASGVFKKVGVAATDFEHKLNKVGTAGDKASNSFGKKLASAGALAAKGFTVVSAAAAVAGAISFKAFASFDKTIRQVGVQTGLSGKALETLSDLALKMGQDTVYSAGQAADAMLELAKGGLTAAEIKGGVLKQTLTLAAAGGLELGDAATYMTNTLNMFGLHASDATKVAAALAGGANASTASVESLGLALSQVGPGAKNAGLSLNETVAVLAEFDQAGIKGADAGTSLKTMLTRLIPSTDKAKAAMKDLGLKFTDANGAFLPIRDIAQQLQDKFKGLTEAQKSQALQTIFGSDATRAASVLLDGGSKTVDKYTKATKDLGAAQKLANTNTSGAAGAMEQFKGSIETLEIKVGKALAPTITKVINKLTDFVNNGLMPMVDFIFKTAIPAIGKFATAMVNKLVPVDQVKEKLGDVTAAIGDFFQGLSGKSTLPTVDLMEHVFDPSKAETLGAKVRSTLQTAFSGGIEHALDNVDWNKLGGQVADALVASLSALAKVAGKITSKIVAVFDAIDWFDVGGKIGGNAVGFALGFISHLGDDLFSIDFWKKHWLDALLAVAAIVLAPAKFIKPFLTILRKIPIAGRLLAWLVEGIRSAGRGVLKTVGRFVAGIGKGIIDELARLSPRVIGRFVTFLSELPTRLGIIAINLREKAASMIKGMGRGIESAGKWIGKATVQIIHGLLKPYTDIGKWLFKKGAELIRGLSRGITSIARTIGSWVRRNVIDKITSPFAKAGSWLYNKGRSIVNGVKSGVSNVARTIGTWVRTNVIDRITSRFAKAKDWLVNAGKNILSGLKSGMSSALGAAKDWFASIGKRIISGVKSFFGIHSPSTVFAGLGGHLIGGLIKGMLSANPLKIATKVFGGVNSALSSMVNKGFIGFEQLSSKALNALGASIGSGISLKGAVGRNQRIAASMLGRFGWGGGQFGPLQALWNGESGWNQFALNRSSGAYGIPQALPASKMASSGRDWRTNPATQIDWGMRYIKSRYGSPANAYLQWQNRRPHWYAKGGWINEPVAGVGLRSGRGYGFGEKGREYVTPAGKMTGGGTVNVGPIYITVDGGKSPRENAIEVHRELVKMAKNGYKIQLGA